MPSYLQLWKSLHHLCHPCPAHPLIGRGLLWPVYCFGLAAHWGWFLGGVWKGRGSTHSNPQIDKIVGNLETMGDPKFFFFNFLGTPNCQQSSRSLWNSTFVTKMVGDEGLWGGKLCSWAWSVPLLRDVVDCLRLWCLLRQRLCTQIYHYQILSARLAVGLTARCWWFTTSPMPHCQRMLFGNLHCLFAI